MRCLSKVSAIFFPFLEVASVSKFGHFFQFKYPSWPWAREAEIMNFNRGHSKLMSNFFFIFEIFKYMRCSEKYTQRVKWGSGKDFFQIYIRKMKKKTKWKYIIQNSVNWQNSNLLIQAIEKKNHIPLHWFVRDLVSLKSTLDFHIHLIDSEFCVVKFYYSNTFNTRWHHQGESSCDARIFSFIAFRKMLKKL